MRHRAWQNRVMRRRHGLFERLEPRLPLATITVTSLADSMDADGQVTLREAVAAANDNTSVDGSQAGSGADTIQFDSSLTSAGAASINLELGPLEITETLTITGAGQDRLTIDAQDNFRIASISGDAVDATIEAITLRDGRTGPDGGAIHYDSPGTLSIIDSKISSSFSSRLGGAIYSERGTVQVVRSTISTNSADDGGGIFARAGSVVIVDSTLVNNRATVGDGGAIASEADSVTLRGSTVSGNSAESNGGGISLIAGTLTVEFSTIHDNSADFEGGGIYVPNSPEDPHVILRNAIVAGNLAFTRAPDFLRDPNDTPDARHSLIGNNIWSGLSTPVAGSVDSNGNILGTNSSPIDPQLTPLFDNGGPTQTHGLLFGSPAIDAGDPNEVAGEDGVPELDQRGLPRVTDGGGGNLRLDIGAVERQVLHGLPFALTVTTLNDKLGEIGGLESEDLSLREAISLAELHPGPDVITFDPTLFTSPATLRLSADLGPLQVTDDLTISGPGREQLTIDAQGQSRILTVPFADPDLTIDQISLTGGHASHLSESGGAIQFLSAGQLTIVESSVHGNQADIGGGLFSTAGRVIVELSTITENSSLFAGGGIRSESGSVSVADSSITNNSVMSSIHCACPGGGISTASGDITLTGSQVSGNESTGSGGGVESRQGAVMIEDSVLTDNESGRGGLGGGAVSTLTGTVSVSRSTIARNRAIIGGGIFSSSGDVLITGSTIDSNSTTSSGSGGGVSAGGTLRIETSTISKNSARFGGGVTMTGSDSIVIINSTISGNTATSRGGGLRISQSPVTMISSTVTGNTAESHGGLYFRNETFDRESLSVTNSIIAANTAESFPAADSFPEFNAPNDGELVVRSSLIGDALGTGLVEAQTADANGNLIGDSGGDGVLAPLLAPLADNGGPTQTHALQEGSPAIDAGDNGLAMNDGTLIINDQRGFVRAFDGGGDGEAQVDMGAFEHQQFTGDLPAGESELAADDGTVFVRHNGSTLFEDRRENVTELNLLGGDHDSTLVLGDLGLHAGQPISLTFDGQGGSDTLRLPGAARTLSLAANVATVLQNIEAIDIAGSGDNTLTLTAEEVVNVTSSANTLRINSNDGDSVEIGAGWEFDSAFSDDGEFFRVLKQGAATLQLNGPHDWSYPANPLDVNGNGSVEALDALIVINELNEPQFSDAATGALVDPAGLATFPGFFYDSSPNGFVVALDALLIVNFLNNPPDSGEGETRRRDFLLIAAPDARVELPSNNAAARRDNAARAVFVEPKFGRPEQPPGHTRAVEETSSIRRRQVVPLDELFANLEWLNAPA